MKNRGNTWENIEILRFYVLVMYNTEIIFIIYIYIYIYDYIMYVELYGCDWLCLKMGGQ